MSKYLITFTKYGYIRYTSHLDMVRLFERVFKRADIRLEYSHGFNPHPKMVFAQPLSLGYTSEGEMLEIETKEHFETGELLRILNEKMPQGIDIKIVEQLPDAVMNQASYSIASLVKSATYTIEIPAAVDNIDKLCEEFMAQSSITVLKKQKKKKHEMKEVDIRPLIYTLSGRVDDKIILTTNVAQGSPDNLSPELLIPAFLAFAGLEVSRSEIEVTRNALLLKE